jgi:hypothetical protein
VNKLLIGFYLAHSWYPSDCCSDRDCHPVSADAVHQMQDGYEAEGIFYPESLVKPSRDARYHACSIPETGKALCFFVPLAV